MKMPIKFRFIFSALIIAFILSCDNSNSKMGWGADAEIYVLADSTIWHPVESILKETFEKPLVTPQRETVFTVIHKDFYNFMRYKNLVFLATLEDSGTVSQAVKSILKPELVEKVKNGHYLFVKKDEWAQDQYIMFLVSNNVTDLIQKISENQNYLFNLFDNYWTEVRAEFFVRGAEEKKMEKHLLNEYGWMLRIQDDFQIEIEDSTENFVMLYKSFPEQWISVHWIETEDPSLITREWCIKKRNEIGARYYRGDQVEEKFEVPIFEEVEFLGKRAGKLSALWQNEKEVCGGSFINYCFYDEYSERIYMLDYALFYPRLDKRKRPYLRKGEILLHTFRTKDEIYAADL